MEDECIRRKGHERALGVGREVFVDGFEAGAVNKVGREVREERGLFFVGGGDR